MCYGPNFKGLASIHPKAGSFFGKKGATLAPLSPTSDERGVCRSGCPSHAGIDSKLMIAGSCGFHRWMPCRDSSFSDKLLHPGLQGNTSCEQWRVYRVSEYGSGHLQSVSLIHLAFLYPPASISLSSTILHPVS